MLDGKKRREARKTPDFLFNSLQGLLSFFFSLALRLSAFCHSPGKSVKSLIRTRKIPLISPDPLQCQIKLDFLDTYPCQAAWWVGAGEYFSYDRKKESAKEKKEKVLVGYEEK